MFWLWGAILSVPGPILFSDVLAVNVFRIISRTINYPRIVISDQVDDKDTLWARSKSAIAKAIRREYPSTAPDVAALEAALATHPVTWHIWQTVDEMRPEYWDFPFVLRPLAPHNLSVNLEFHCTVRAVMRDAAAVGYVVGYHPTGKTARIIERIYQSLMEQYVAIDNIPYVVQAHATGDALPPSERYVEPPPLSEEEKQYLGCPHITLYANRTQDSVAAFRALERSGILFTVKPSPRRKQPAVDWGGMVLTGLPAVEQLAQKLREAEEQLSISAPDRPAGQSRKRDPELAGWMQARRDQELVEARAVLDRLLKHSGRSALK